jgi:hypothetical protein
MDDGIEPEADPMPATSLMLGMPLMPGMPLMLGVPDSLPRRRASI